MVFLWRAGAISGTGMFPSAHPLRPSRSCVDSSCTLTHQSERSGRCNHTVVGSLFMVFLVKLCMVYYVIFAYAKEFVFVFMLYHPEMLEDSLKCHIQSCQKIYSLQKDLLFVYGLYSFVPIVKMQFKHWTLLRNNVQLAVIIAKLPETG